MNHTFKVINALRIIFPFIHKQGNKYILISKTANKFKYLNFTNMHKMV